MACAVSFVMDTKHRKRYMITVLHFCRMWMCGINVARHLNEVEAVQHVHLNNIPRQYLRRTHVRSMHSTSGVCICYLASNDTTLLGTMMYGG